MTKENRTTQTMTINMLLDQLGGLDKERIARRLDMEPVSDVDRADLVVMVLSVATEVALGTNDAATASIAGECAEWLEREATTKREADEQALSDGQPRLT